jgi:hypothetical protein
MIQPPLPWQVDAQAPFVPISLEGQVVAYCHPGQAQSVAAILNEHNKMKKALKLACYDLVARTGGSSDSVNELMQQYLNRVSRPTQGTALIALLLKQRQQDLDLTAEEFAKFCDSYRLSREELQAIYHGVDLDNSQLSPLARILGLTVDEVIDAWGGRDNAPA